jgi:uncharacterized protein YdiU (UPF0061 family)
MGVATGSLFTFESSFARDLPDLCRPWEAAPAPQPELLTLNERLATELGLEPAELRTPEGIRALVGNVIAEGSSPVAMAYAGHQFGLFVPLLGDGRALLLGEVVDGGGRRRDVHLKGSGRTPFARGGDGKATVGPMLREHLISEAMHGLGIPTTRSLAVVATGEQVARETMLPGAVLTRVASSHLRVGTFQFAATQSDAALLRRLADHAIARHHPHVLDAEHPYLAFLQAVVDAQASLLARWMLVGFVHGVMNTDNTTISGETIDYGPCAFLDAFDPAAVFSSIDHGGRYAYGNQPTIAQWNVARLAEAILPLIDADTDAAVAAATEVLRSYPERFDAGWRGGMQAKLGLRGAHEGDGELIDDLLGSMQAQQVDHTALFRGLSAAVRGEPSVARSLFVEPRAFDDWSHRWLTRVGADGTDRREVAASMDRVNPVYSPRNHLVEEALAAGVAGDLGPFEQMLDVLADPFRERPGLARYAEPAPEGFGPYRTFCGT